MELSLRFWLMKNLLEQHLELLIQLNHSLLQCYHYILGASFKPLMKMLRKMVEFIKVQRQAHTYLSRQVQLLLFSTFSSFSTTEIMVKLIFRVSILLNKERIRRQ